jgi:DNA-binding CsgD family transcriptional regulator/tetratricopeptide (TPR) repeat protein
VLLERERELVQLEDAFGRVAEGIGCAVGIEAGPGLGKTSLLKEARAAGEATGLNVLAGRATELEVAFPFALVRQLLVSNLVALPEIERDRVFDGATAARSALGLEPDDDQGQDAFAVLHALYWVTAALAERGPLLMAIDDAHTADASSLDYLGFLLPRLEELPVLLIVTGRPDEPGAPSGFRRLMSDSLVSHMFLTPLSAEAAKEVLAEELKGEPEPAFAATCHEVSGGNPFLLRELARTLAQRGVEPALGRDETVRGLVPERVSQTVSRRLERLSPDAGMVARSLAVLGDGSDPRLIADLAGVGDGSSMDELRAAAIMAPNPSPRFIHPLVRSAIYADFPVVERERSHARAAALLRERGADPEQIAGQLLAAGASGDRATVETLIEAGERSLGKGAPRSAIAYLNRARREPPPADLRAAVLEPLISAVVRVGDRDTFAEIEGDVLAEMEQDPQLRSRWAILLTLALALSGRFEDAISLLRDAVAVAEEQGEFERAYVLCAQINTLAVILRSPQQEPFRHTDRIDPNSAAGRLAATVRARAAAVGGSAADAAAAARQALGDDAAIFAEDLGVTAAVGVVLMLVAADDMEAARRATRRALGIARERGATSSLVRALMLSSCVGWGEGDLVSAEPDMRQAIELARTLESTPMILSIAAMMVEILIERDELEAADRELALTGMVDGPMPESPLFTLLLYARGRLRFEKGEFDLASEDFSALSSPPVSRDLDNLYVSHAGPLAARSLRVVGDLERARKLAASIESLARRWGSPSTTAHALRTRAAAREGGAAVGDLEAAVTMLERSPRQLEYAHALLELGEALRRDGGRARAREPLRKAFDVARHGGAIRVARRAHGELQATGEKIRPYAPIGVESLTPSERRVADLAASGMTNRQIAQSLFVTVKTVEAHLSAAYGKLDISSRRQLPDALSGRL